MIYSDPGGEKPQNSHQKPMIRDTRITIHPCMDAYSTITVRFGSQHINESLKMTAQIYEIVTVTFYAVLFLSYR